MAHKNPLLLELTSSQKAPVCRWDKNWIIHLDGVFQTADRVGDHHVHVARGMRRLVINDTMADVEEGYEGEPLSSVPAQLCQHADACLHQDLVQLLPCLQLLGFLWTPEPMQALR